MGMWQTIAGLALLAPVLAPAAEPPGTAAFALEAGVSFDGSDGAAVKAFAKDIPSAVPGRTLDQVKELAPRGDVNADVAVKAVTRTLDDAMPVLKKGLLEGEAAFVGRARDGAEKALERIFPASDGYGLKLSFVWKCNSRDDFWDKSGVSGTARWEHAGWRYAAEVWACEGPLRLGYVAIIPLSPSAGMMPRSKEDFISLVQRLTRLRIADAEEYDFLGYREFSKNLDIRPELQVPAEIKTTHTSTGRPEGFAEDVGAIFLKGLEDADLRYFPGL